MAEFVSCVAHITIKFEQEVPEGQTDLSDKSLKKLEELMQADLLRQIREDIISEEDVEVENLELLVHVDISVKE